MRMVGSTCGYTFSPGMPESFRRRSWTISSAVGRWSAGLSRMKMRPVFMTTLDPLAPMAEKYCCT